MFQSVNYCVNYIIILYIKNKLYKPIITISEKLFRPAEIDILRGDSTETYKELNWKPKINFKDLVRKMCLYDYNLLSNKNIEINNLENKLNDINNELIKLKKDLQ